MATKIIGQGAAAPILPKNEVAPCDKVGIPLDYLGSTELVMGALRHRGDEA